MAKLTVTRGLPGSGKTTAARATGDLCVSRDDIRQMLYGKRYGEEGVNESIITSAEDALVATLLEDGCNVVVHDTNLRDRHVDIWRYLAVNAGADFEIIDLRAMPLRICIRRDEQRWGTPAHVGEEVIRKMYDEHIINLDL